MSFPNKDQRKQCWAAKDVLWSCLDASASEEECARVREAYIAACPSQWVTHFDRKREYVKFKERMEKEGYDPVTQETQE